MSGFSTLNTAVTGLAAAQRAMDAVSQNVVNANTPGYSRQRVLLESTGPASTASLHSGRQAVFGGVKVTEVTRIRDAYLESTRAAAGARYEALSARADVLSAAQLLLAEPGDTGMQSTMDAFYASWQDLANNPVDTAAGSVVVQRGIAVANQLRSMSVGVAAQWTTSKQNLVNLVAEVNQATTDLAVVNKAIRAAESAEAPVNELLDTRDLYVRKLADLVGAEGSVNEDGRLTVSVNGITLVSGPDRIELSLDGGNDVTEAAADPPTLYAGSIAVPLEYGKATGLLTLMRSDLPTMSATLDAVAVGIRDAVNAVHNLGYTLSGSAGGDFFDGTGAYDLSVVPATGDDLAITSDPAAVNGDNAQAIGDLADDAVVADLLGTEGPSEVWRQLSTSTGVQLQSLLTALQVQDSVVGAAEAAVEADAGVNLDEEMTAMMLYQRSYQASARALTTMDDMLDTLVNRTGMVGR